MRIMGDHGKEEKDKMKIVGEYGREDIAKVYASKMTNGVENEDCR